jgi:hypothetical protein
MSIHGVPLAARPPVSIAFIARHEDSVDRSTYTFASVTLGRLVCVKTGAGTAVTVSSMTIGGVSATLVKRQQDTGGPPAEQNVEIWCANSNVSGTGNIVVTLSGTASQCGIGVFSAANINPTAHDIAGAGRSGGSSDITDTIDIPAGGGALLVCSDASGSATAFTITGLTERYDALVESPQTHGGASDNFAAAQTGLTLTVQASAAAGRACFAAASFRKA